MMRTAVVLLLIMPMAASSAMMPAIVATAYRPAYHHVQPHGAHGGHGFQLVQRQDAAFRRRNHAFVFRHGDERAAQSAHDRRRHAAFFTFASFNNASAAQSLPCVPQTVQAMASRMRATESPTAGVGASDKSNAERDTQHFRRFLPAR